MTETTSNRTWIEPIDVEGLLRQAMLILAGNAQIRLEGDFNLSDLSDFDNIGAMPMIPDGCGRASPDSQSVVVLPLEPETLSPLFDLFDRRELRDKMEAVQILKAGVVQFLAGDCFYPECISVGSVVSSSILKQQAAKGLISAYSLANEFGQIVRRPI